MYPAPSYGGARAYGRRPTGYRALGFIPAECLVHHYDVGFQWLCGEPVPAEVLPLLANSQVENPITSEVIPQGTPDPDAPGHYVPDAGTTPQDPQPSDAPPKEAGFGILGVVASIIVGAALTRALGG